MRRLVCALLVALALPASASAHAFLVRAAPAPGVAIASAPSLLVLDYDEPVTPRHVSVTSRSGSSAVAGKPRLAPGRATEIIVPLRPHLPRGGYTVRWSEIDQDDGHLVSGAYAFAVGAGEAVPAVAGGGGSSFDTGDAVARWLLLVGLLLAAGAVVFARAVVETPRRRLYGAGALAVAALGAVLLLARQPGLATRFDKITLGGAVAAVLVAAALAASERVRALRLPADAAAVVVLALPTLDGHAVAHGPSHLLSVPSDLVHLLGAATWIGGVCSLLVLVPASDRAAATRRFAPVALVAVVAIAVTGALRALGELRTFSQLWSTSYGQTILVKTALFVFVLGLAAAARGRVRGRLLIVDAGALLVLVAAVAVLVSLRPGRDVRALAAPSAPAFVTAGEAGSYAVGVALSPDARGVRARANVLGVEGPADGLNVTISISGRSEGATSCGDGCYEAVVPVARPRTLRVGVGAKDVDLVVPQDWPAPSAAPIVAQATRTFRALRSVTFSSRLASSPTDATTTLWQMAAPNKLRGIEEGTGAGEILIGNRRWDRDAANEKWVESPQTPIAQPSSPWPSQVRDAQFVGSGVVRGRPVWIVTFVDPITPAWFRIAVDKQTSRTYSMNMVATAHFMREDYRDFDKPLSIAPPPTR